MKKIQILSVLAITGVIAIFSCNKEMNHSGLVKQEPKLPAVPFNYQSKNGRVDNNLATLGRVLFYDKALSANNAVSCGSCHNQANGFAESRKVSNGFTNEITTRNSIAIQNLGVGRDSSLIIFPGQQKSVQHLFWDGRSKSVEDLMLLPIANHIEMGQDIASLPEKLNKLPYYKALVQNAFGQEKLDINSIVSALTNFVASIRSNDSPFDEMAKTGSLKGMSPLALQGQALFTNQQYNCVGCHTSVFAGNMIDFGGSVYGGDPNDSTRNFAANIGLPGDDKGIGALSGKPQDMGVFKIPDLHNIAVTGPYMHDGRFSSLDEVLEHYSHGIANSNSLDNRLRNQDGSPKVMNIPAEDKRALIAFLNSLTSTSSLTSQMYSNPF